MIVVLKGGGGVNIRILVDDVGHLVCGPRYDTVATERGPDSEYCRYAQHMSLGLAVLV